MGANLHRHAGGADRIVVIDTETTGLYNSDRVVEIAAVTLSLDGTLIDVWDTLIQPLRDVSASWLHGITASMVTVAPTFEDIAGDLSVRLHGACVAAHNLPFDTRMLRNEFARIGAECDIPAGLDTLRATGERLHVACAARSIPHNNAHRALNDAHAVAALIQHVINDDCPPGSPARMTTSLRRTGRVLRRDDANPAVLPDPPLISYLASRLEHRGTPIDTLAYLDLLARATGDLHLDRTERAQLAELAHQLGLNDAQIAQAHRRFINELIDAAISDHTVTPDEHEALIRTAAALDLSQRLVEDRIHPYRQAASTITLSTGMTIVITGEHHDLTREEVGAHAQSIGLTVQRGINKQTQLLAAADLATNSGKAAAARRYNVPIISLDDLVSAAAGETLLAVATDTAGIKAVTCPDCLATRAVSARDTGTSRRRCNECAGVIAARPKPTPTPPKSKTPPSRQPWPPPTIEWLTCTRCGVTWHREVLRGRKPTTCPQCADR